ncbi:hypothetical protein KEM52_004357 [Ascosphaera acerosa]|nr:hypothetical protein KEM52_004357 [Ascosphaera acerosa]
MMARSWTRLISLAAAALLPAAAIAASIKCDESNHCPSDYPCCSQYGECGTGAYCLGGCDPRSSFHLDSCVPNPVCQSKTYDWDSLDDVQPNTKYLGNADAADWVSSGTVLSSGGNLVMTMAPDTVGTLVSSTHYIWYGKVSARMKSSRGAGVVTAFILMSDVKDELDYEMIGADLEEVQTNYYFQGIPDWTKVASAHVSDTFENYHTYEFDWQPDHITWSIDGQEVRTLTKDETYNETTKQYRFPQSPSRLQLSLWPAGLKNAAQGTIEWAGGLVDWKSEDIKKTGYYYSLVDKVDIQCYDPPASAGGAGKAWKYKDYGGVEGSLESTSKLGVLKTFYGDGENLDRDPDAPKSKSTATSSTTETTTSTTSSMPSTTLSQDATSTMLHAANNTRVVSTKTTSTTVESTTTVTTTAKPTATHNTDNLIPGVVGAGNGIHADPNKHDDDDDGDDGKDAKKDATKTGDSNAKPTATAATPNPVHPDDEDADFDQGAVAGSDSGAQSLGGMTSAALAAVAMAVAAAL